MVYSFSKMGGDSTQVTPKRQIKEGLFDASVALPLLLQTDYESNQDRIGFHGHHGSAFAGLLQCPDGTRQTEFSY
ncbi:hypothetical protein SDC9_184161 [bioreactor metagenome]|uniref:Uncharacterized protein n=1 Tax=bioreactor metagenome TaxID=1076179 RepID=A0A645HC94_9ZZZZ